MDISFIVSAYERPTELELCLLSLRLQKNVDFEVIVTDNSLDAKMQPVVEKFDVPFIYTNPKLPNCYYSAEYGATIAKGEYLCFPSDDSYYVSGFAERMLAAARMNAWDFVYCDCIYDPRMRKKYSILDVNPMVGSIDKTSFIVKRSQFLTFPDMHRGVTSDGQLAVELAGRVPHGKVPEPMVFHN